MSVVAERHKWVCKPDTFHDFKVGDKQIEASVRKSREVLLKSCGEYIFSEHSILFGSFALSGLGEGFIKLSFSGMTSRFNFEDMNDTETNKMLSDEEFFVDEVNFRFRSCFEDMMTLVESNLKCHLPT
jgi:hypothetical protein